MWQFQWLAISTILVLAGLRVIAADIPISHLPPAVTHSLAQAFPGATILAAERDTDMGEVVYELDLRTKGLDLEATFSASGKLLSTEEKLPAAMLPDAVRHAVQQKYAKGDVTELRRYTIAEGQRVLFKVEVRDNGQERALVVDSEGTILFDRDD